jgi:hypothetical protein
MRMESDMGGVSFGVGSMRKVEVRGEDPSQSLGGLEGVPSLAYIQEDFT